MNRVSQVLFNAVSNYGRFFISILIMGLLTPYLVSKLGVDDFGLWSLTLSFLGFFSLLDIGLGTALVKYVAECRGAGELDRRNRIVSTLFVSYLGLTGLSVLLLAAISPFYAGVMSLPSEDHHRGLVLLWLMGLRLVFVPLPLSLFRSVLHGEQKFYQVNLIQAVTLALYGLGAYFVLQRGGDVFSLAYLQLGTMVLEYLSYVWLVYRGVERFQLAPRLFSREIVKEVGGFSMAAMVVNVAGLILLRTDPLIVKLFLPLSAVGIYAVALKVAEALLMLLKQAVNVLSPFIAELKGEEQTEKIKFIFLNCTKFALAPALAAGLFLIHSSSPLLELWIGPEFLSGSTTLQILVLSVLLSIPQMIASNVLTMTGHHRLTAKAAGQSAALNLVLSLALVPFLGLEGVALATLITTVAVDIAVVLRVACRQYQVNLGDYSRRVLKPLLLPTAAQGAALYGLGRVECSHLGQLLLGGGLTALVFLAVFAISSLEKSEQELLRKKLRKR